MHRWTLGVYVLGVIHTIGAGTDAGTLWLIGILIATGAPIALLAAIRWFPSGTRQEPSTPPDSTSLAAVLMAEYRRYRRPLPSTKAVTAKIAVLAVVGALAIGALISVEMASGNDPALGQKATRVKQASTGSSNSSASSAGSDSYPNYGYGAGNSLGSSGDSTGSGYGTQQYSPPPVTSSTS